MQFNTEVRSHLLALVRLKEGRTHAGLFGHWALITKDNDFL